MLTRYFSSTIPKPEVRLCDEIQALGDNYAAILACVKRYPVDVIRQCCDVHGNTVLQMVLMKHGLVSSSKQDAGANGEDDPAVQPSTADFTATPRSPRRRRWSILGGPVEKPTFDPVVNVDQNLPNLLQYLIHSVYPAIDQIDGMDHDHMGLNVVDDSFFLLQQPPTRYNSLVRLPNQETGQLPLHTACSSRQAVPLLVLEYVIAAFPKAVQSPDVYGNLPLHAAAQHTAPLEALKLLVQQYPEAIKTQNDDGNLPLHLAAAAETYKEEGPTVLDNSTFINFNDSLRTPNNTQQRQTVTIDEDFMAFQRVPMMYTQPHRSMSNDELDPRVQRNSTKLPERSWSSDATSCSFIKIPMLFSQPKQSMGNDTNGQSSNLFNDNRIPSPRRGVRRMSNLASTPIFDMPVRQDVRRVASMAPPPPLLCRNGSFSVHELCHSADFTRMDGSSDLSMSRGGHTSRNYSGNSISPVRGSVVRKASSDSHSSSNSQYSPFSRPSRNQKSLTGPPPAAAFCKKPLSQATVEQRDMVAFLVDCWPESVYETNNNGQTAEQMATGSTVTLLLKERSRGAFDNINRNVATPMQSSLQVQCGSVMLSPVYQWERVKEKSTSSFMVSSSPSSSFLSNGMIKAKRTAPRSSKSALVQ